MFAIFDMFKDETKTSFNASSEGLEVTEAGYISYIRGQVGSYI